MRSLLVLASLAVASGMLGTTVYTQQPCQPTVTGKLETFALESRTFHNARTLRVWLPPQFDPARSIPSSTSSTVRAPSMCARRFAGRSCARMRPSAN